MLKSIKDDKLFFISNNKENTCATHGTAGNMFVPDLARNQLILCYFNHVMARIYSKKYEIIVARVSAMMRQTWHKCFFGVRNYFYFIFIE